MGTQSRLTSQGQISVPAEVRRKLGLGPGSIVQWEERDGEYVVRRAGRFSSADIHAELFGTTAPAKARPADIREGIRSYVRKRRARR